MTRFAPDHRAWSSGQEREGSEGGLDDVEVPAVGRRDLACVESFGRRDDAGVDGAEVEVSVAGDEFGDAEPVAGCDGFGEEVAGGEVADEADLGLGAEPGGDQVDDLGDDQGRDDQGSWVGLEEVEAGGVVGV